MKKEIEKNKKKIAGIEIIILLIGSFAFGFILGEIGVVSAEGTNIDRTGEGVDFNQKNDKTGGLLSSAASIASGFYKTGIIGNLGWATAANIVIRQLFGNTEESKAAANAISAGIFGGKTIAGAIAKETATSKAGIFASGKVGSFLKLEWTGSELLMTHPAFVWGVAITAIVFAATYKKTKTKYIDFNCKPWDAPQGGSKCEECNKNEMFDCSEYQCRSLGQGCELIEEKCVWVNERDSKYPVITLNTEVLPDNLKYSEDNAVSPPNRGVKVLEKESADGCVDSATPIAFGINTDEPAKCRIDIERKAFDAMANSFGASTLSYNHSIIFGLLSPNEEGLEIQPGKNYNFYVKCQDANGNENTAEFIFKMCVKSGPDKNAPIVYGTNLLNEGSIIYGQDSVDFSLYINEKGTCKWSNQDKIYEDMENTMTCETTPEDEEQDYEMVYRCDTKLTSLKDRQDNKFYFRCKDENNNANQDSFPFVLKGTQPLLIDYVAPNGTIKDSTKDVKVYLEAKTSAGADEGKAVCYYSETGKDNTWIPFYYEDNSYYTHYQHKQMLELESGTYSYYIKCQDIGLNTETKKIDFKVESDTSSAVVIRAYKEENSLKILTNEKAECVYDIKNCNYVFSDGLKMSSTDKKKHSVIWNTGSTYYIKCKDEYGNEPYPGECSIIIKPIDLVKNL